MTQNSIFIPHQSDNPFCNIESVNTKSHLPAEDGSLSDCLNFVFSRKLSFLLHRYTLGQIPWFIYVRSSEDGHVIGEYLEGNDGDYGG